MQLFNFFQFFGNLQKLLLATYRQLESNLRGRGDQLSQLFPTYVGLAKLNTVTYF
jgi:hypothetical protein